MATIHINTIEIMDQKKFDQISFRKFVIEELLRGGKKPLPMVNTGNDNSNMGTSKKTKDIRTLLDKRNFDFYKIINEIGGRLMYVKSGTTGHTFKGVSLPECDKSVNYALKVVAYPKKENYGDIYDSQRPENAELFILKILSYFVINNQTPHIVLPFCTFYTDIKPFLNLSKDNFVNNKKYDLFIERYKKKDYYKNVSVLMSEWANTGDLLDYIRNNYKKMTLKDWRVIFFQILSVLAIIQNKYPGFRHNDLKANNILMHKIDTRKKNNKFKYRINFMDFIVPNIGYQIKIWDFDFACIPGIVENSKVRAKWTSKINVNPEKNMYYDMHYFFNTLTRKGFFPHFWESKYVSKQIKDFVKRVVPDELRVGNNVATRGRLLKNLEYTTPFKVLKEDPFFNKLRRVEDRVPIL